MRRYLSAAALLLATVALCLAQEGPELQQADRAELKWRVAAPEHLFWKLEAQETLPAPADPNERVTGPGFSFVHLFGYEFDECGILGPRVAPLTAEDLVWQLASHLPGAKLKSGATWRREWQDLRVANYAALSVQSQYEFASNEAVDSRTCAVVRGVHTLRPADPDKPAPAAPFWSEFRAETTLLFEGERGRAVAFSTDLHARHVAVPANEKEAVPHRLDWRGGWKLDRELDSNAVRELNGKVSNAIRSGVERLWKQRDKEGLWPYGEHKRGGTALALLALLMCDVDPADARITQSFARMKEQPLSDTYDVGMSIMAIEALYITAEERRAFLAEDGKVPEFKRDLSAADRAEVQRLMDWLVANQNEPNPFWNYYRGKETAERHDFSVTQYAWLGMAAALRCGVKPPPHLIVPFTRKLMEWQAPDGPKLKRVIGGQPPKEGKTAPRVTRATTAVTARGWGYSAKATWDKYTEATNAYGSMTCAGLTCLYTALDIVEQMDAVDRQKAFGNEAVRVAWTRDVQASVESGLAWMEHWFSVTRNPNNHRYSYCYYMYGLERIGMMGGLRYLGEHNWYYEGVCPLLAQQDGEGGWGGFHDTSFALLFLKKGSVPSRSRVVTSDK
ncbi:MAG: hypothetical protein IT463_04840 [Planctomycetes bacterium]|nr:hypothetical protein [Planctomycetota bacterium]